MPSRAEEASPLPATPSVVPPVRAVALALLVPLAVTVLGLLPWRVLPHVDGHDRALVWIAGSDGALRDAATAVAGEPAFSGGATSASPARPTGCPRGALRLHFDFARTDQAQAARAALEHIAADAGAQVCASHRFELNREDARPAVWLPLAASLLLPVGLLLAVRTLLPTAAPEPADALAMTSAARQGIALLSAGLLATCVLPLPGAAADAGSGALLMAMAMGPPAIHEAAFRGWLVPRLAAVVGAPAALAGSFVASVVAAAPVAGPAALAATLTAAAGCVAFACTRSLPACIGAHLLLAALLRLVPGS